MAINYDLVIIEGTPYRVLPFDEGKRKGLKYDYAYHIKSTLLDIILPYKGEVESMSVFHEEEFEYGIYTSSTSGYIYFHLPTTKKKKEEYSSNKVKSFDDDSIFEGITFKDSMVDLDIDGDAFKPPIRTDDDAMNVIVKAAVTSKALNFDAYKSRFDIMGVAGKTGNVNTNNKNNSKRAFLTGKSMSCNKALEYGDILGYDYAILVQDKPDAIHKMNDTKGKPLVIYVGNKFDTSNPIEVQDILETIYRTE